MKKAVLSKFRQREFIVYIMSGIIVTLVNWLSYTLLENLFIEGNWRVANFISISLSIVVAYTLNRIFVFRSKQKFFPEVIYFFLSRSLISLIFEHGIMEFLLSAMNFDPRISVFSYDFQIVKVIGSIFVILANYFVSKYFVFKAK